MIVQYIYESSQLLFPNFLGDNCGVVVDRVFGPVLLPGDSVQPPPPQPPPLLAQVGVVQVHQEHQSSGLALVNNLGIGFVSDQRDA